jgi:hypothetical protein
MEIANPKDENFHYSSISDDNENKEDKVAAYITPKINKTNELNVMKENSSHHSAKKNGLRDLLRRTSWPNPFLQGG